jgi:hypothetical protein
MKALSRIIALAGLALTTAGPVLVFTGHLCVETNKQVMLAGMVIWFIGAVPWLGGREVRPSDKEVEI